MVIRTWEILNGEKRTSLETDIQEKKSDRILMRAETRAKEGKALLSIVSLGLFLNETSLKKTLNSLC